jgi:hypothetical protein
LLQSVDYTYIQDPKDILSVKKYIDSGLQCLADSFFLKTPTREWSDRWMTVLGSE